MEISKPQPHSLKFLQGTRGAEISSKWICVFRSSLQFLQLFWSLIEINLLKGSGGPWIMVYSPTSLHPRCLLLLGITARSLVRDERSSFYPEATWEPVRGSKDTEPEGDTDVAPGSGFPWTLAAVSLALGGVYCDSLWLSASAGH